MFSFLYYVGIYTAVSTDVFSLEKIQQREGKAQLHLASTISLLDVQTVDTHPLIVSPGMNKTAVAPVLLITRCAICHVQLLCLLRYIVRAGKSLTLFHFSLCLSVNVLT